MAASHRAYHQASKPARHGNSDILGSPPVLSAAANRSTRRAPPFLHRNQPLSGTQTLPNLNIPAGPSRLFSAPSWCTTNHYTPYGLLYTLRVLCGKNTQARSSGLEFLRRQFACPLGVGAVMDPELRARVSGLRVLRRVDRITVRTLLLLLAIAAAGLGLRLMPAQRLGIWCQQQPAQRPEPLTTAYSPPVPASRDATLRRPTP
ncbi:hypothetical protein CMUS01_02655 [Colletotrichum musicola]|uniref:Uncharacterized protein n=1 Tax=Colletotrichum musicola TaxID=2175873 RepID=A0A8H6NUS7_9PEZI|nr:hypothetical protein CMUS01_02655 [Colletotrichum musicola]